MSIVAAMAMSYYQYNVRPLERAEKLFNHFEGACSDLATLVDLVDHKNWSTEMAYPTAVVYLNHAMERYAEEAAQRCKLNDVAIGEPVLRMGRGATTADLERMARERKAL
jgi:hypothetical protein